MAISCFPSITAIPLFFPMNMNFLRSSVCMTELPTLRYKGSNTLCIPEISVSSHRIPLTVWGSLMTVLLLIFWAMLLRFHENDIESIFTKDSTGNSVTEILNYLNRHYQSVTLREAAKHFGYSTSHFSTLIKESPEHFMRTFKKTYRMTPGETGRRTGNKRLQDLIYFLYNRYRSGRYLSYPPL